MNRKRIPLFLNPAAGRGRARRTVRSIIDVFESLDVEIDLRESTAEKDLERQVHHAACNGVQEIIVAGGDGSVHEAVNGILAAGAETAFGVVPIGTGNDFAKSIGSSLDWHQATSRLAKQLRQNAPYKRIDAGKMNTRFFANGAGIGFDAKINEIAKKYHWPIGNVVYLFAVIEGLLDGVTTPTVRMRYTGGDYEGPITLASISNGPWVGGMFHIAPMAKNDDGLFDLVIAKPMSRCSIVRLLPKLVLGRHIGQADIDHAEIVELDLSAAAPVPSHLDGENQSLQTEFSIRLLRNALLLI